MFPMRGMPGGAMPMLDPATMLWHSLFFPAGAQPVPPQAILPSPPNSVREASPPSVKVEISTSSCSEEPGKNAVIQPRPVSSAVTPDAPAGVLVVGIHVGSRRYCSVVCCREKGFEPDAVIEMSSSLRSCLRQSADGAICPSTGTVLRRIACGEELTLACASPLSPHSSSGPGSVRDPGSPSAKGDTDAVGCGSKGFGCDRCGKVFSYEYYRDKHLKYTRCVDQGDRKFPCPLCPRSFEKRDRLRIHVLHVHENHRPHSCSVCAKSFSQSSSLNKHLRVHSGERPYACPFCSKSFTASSILRTHIRQHSGEKPFKCAHCGKAFASHAAHDSHVRRSHASDQ